MKKILIVEDDKDIGKALTIRLKATGYQIFTAEDVVQGVNQVVQNPPDLVLVDISIPAGNGFLFVERIRCLPEIGKIPVIFMTANKLPELRQKAEQLGAVGYFEKPFDSSKLLSSIEKVLMH